MDQLVKARKPGALPPGRWAYLKALQPSPGRYFHVSCFANMVPHPINPMLPAIPFIEKPGITFKRGMKPRTDPRDKRGFKTRSK